jgi:hypothetical protein
LKKEKDLTREVRYGHLQHRNVCWVPVGKDGRDGEALLYAESYRALMEHGCPSKWFLIGRSVCTSGIRSKTLMIARLLTYADPGQKVIYVNDDPFDLRLQNLGLIPGYSKTSDIEVLEEMQRLKKARQAEQLATAEEQAKKHSRFYSIRTEDA